jgi:hypothetical protein
MTVYLNQCFILVLPVPHFEIWFVDALKSHVLVPYEEFTSVTHDGSLLAKSSVVEVWVSQRGARLSSRPYCIIANEVICNGVRHDVNSSKSHWAIQTWEKRSLISYLILTLLYELNAERSKK